MKKVPVRFTEITASHSCGVMSSAGLIRGTPALLTSTSNPGNFWGDNYKVWETVARPFIKFDMKGDAWGMPFEGNVGMMVSYADQSSFGYSGNGSNVVFPVTGGASYFDFLPSLNLIFKPTPKDLIRFS